MLSVEIHSHSAASHDGRDPVESLLQRAADVGLDALAVTDHNEIEASRRAVELAPEYGLLGIPGIEVSSKDGHVLGIGVEVQIERGHSFVETVDRIRAAGGIAVVPHPFQETRSGVGTKVSLAELTKADAIEVYNSRLLTGFKNRKARRFAVEHGLPMTAGSDAHVAEMVGRAVTRIDTDDRSVGAIIDAIRDGRTEVDGQRTPYRISFRQAAGGAKRRLLRRLPGQRE